MLKTKRFLFKKFDNFQIDDIEKYLQRIISKEDIVIGRMNDDNYQVEITIKDGKN
jgi:hypothetical protein